MSTMASNAALDITIGVESQHKNMEIAVSRRGKYMAMSIEKSVTPLPEYEGPYSVTPKLYIGNTLETKGKSMRDNVSVGAIPIFDVSNPAGGRTVTIGSI